jgi:dihydrolipoamide dehydrogenase
MPANEGGTHGPYERVRSDGYTDPELAISIDRTDGLTKLLLDPDTGRVLGVGMVGSGAGELIAEGVLAIEMGATATDMKLSIHPHPTLTETLMESAEVFYGQATHVYRPTKK